MFCSVLQSIPCRDGRQNVAFLASGLILGTPATPSAHLDSGQTCRDLPAALGGVASGIMYLPPQHLSALS